jgi:predicted HAD superfamily Cof-like phosphohydrolase
VVLVNNNGDSYIEGVIRMLINGRWIKSMATLYLEEFHKAFVPKDRDVRTVRADLLNEEHIEVQLALQDGDLEAIAKELADLVYVAYGTALVYDIDLDWALREVHISNMTKLGLDGKPVLREDGKVLKGPNYVPPDMRGALRSKE